MHNRPAPDRLREPQQIAVRILYEKLALASLTVADPVPGFMRCAEQRPVCTRERVKQRIKVVDKNLEVDAAPERALPIAGSARCLR